MSEARGIWVFRSFNHFPQELEKAVIKKSALHRPPTPILLYPLFTLEEHLEHRIMPFFFSWFIFFPLPFPFDFSFGKKKKERRKKLVFLKKK